MPRFLALFSGSILVLAGAAGAAAAGTAGLVPSASPQPVGAASRPTAELTVVPDRGALELDAREPKGILLRGAFGTSGAATPYLRVEWGATLPAVKQALSSLPGFPAGDPLSCFERDGDTFCFATGKTLEWADLGAALKSPARPGLLFAPDGRFCHYALSFSRSDFDAVRAALEAELGPPTSDTPSQTKDPAGAHLDQRLIVWTLRHVSVALQQRNPRTPDESEVHVLYTPIAGDTK
jgi:hypothetical protein